ncbi:MULTISPECIES: helix-turn-helix domain-containing protein [Bacillota]|uniref:helix-turn-helix domain-containing protein n=1 Tax=Bacillota TaxID=1239 RepID=UPI000E496604|nr:MULTISPECIES: helix-turn-helix transcriptional regulator [Bacillota]RHT91990.1 XRE family transcriptional regulator [Coprobacillus sp. AM28-15LB]
MSSGCGKRTQEDVGKLVESWRKMAGWTQETLAGYLGISAKQYRRICRKYEYQFTGTQAKFLSELSGISMEDLFPDVDICIDSRFLANIKKMPSSQQTEKITMVEMVNSDDENDNLIIEYAGEIMRIQDKELKADITNQLGGLVKLSRRLDQKKKG